MNIGAAKKCDCSVIGMEEILIIAVTLQATSISLWITAILSGSWVPMISSVSSSCARTWWDSKTQMKFLEKSNFHTRLTQSNSPWLEKHIHTTFH